MNKNILKMALSLKHQTFNSLLKNCNGCGQRTLRMELAHKTNALTIQVNQKVELNRYISRHCYFKNLSYPGLFLFIFVIFNQNFYRKLQASVGFELGSSDYKASTLNIGSLNTSQTIFWRTAVPTMILRYPYCSLIFLASAGFELGSSEQKESTLTTRPPPPWPTVL